MEGKTEKLRAWFVLSRPPFHLVGVLPFALGSLFAWNQRAVFRFDIFLLGTTGLMLIMLATYYSGEYWDWVEDSLVSERGQSRFSGGSQVLQRGLISRNVALRASLTCVLLSIGVGMILQFVYFTGSLTLPFGILGIIAGFFYSAKPVRWVARGLGEIWIAICYGWLPVIVGNYLQTAEILPLLHWLSVPISLTIFNVILLNEFPDYGPDSTAGKMNLAVRIGLPKSSLLYASVAVASWVFVTVSYFQGVPAWAILWYLPILLVSILLVILLLQQKWKDASMLEKLCGANLMVNIGTTVVYMLAFAV